MKKAIVLSFVLSGILMASAQVQVGVKGGGNAHLVYLKMTDTSPLRPIGYTQGANPGIYGAAFLAYSWKNWAIQLELQYADRGKVLFSSRAWVQSPVYSAPLLIRRRMFSCFWVEAGPELSLRGRATLRRADGVKQGVPTLYEKPKEIGVNLGLMAAPWQRFRFGIRYYQGLSSISGILRFPDQIDPVLGFVSGGTGHLYTSTAMIYTEWLLLRKRK
ncbi:MAG: hypothetical protein EAZ89_17780 [Bacteroidetes bacterium]|nr:MAG: hypothetical protein EAZ89_17780 [Bacteroidota bacterium]